MRRPTDDALITKALHDLDRGGSEDLTTAERERADAAFNRIVATPTDEHVETAANRPHWRRRRLLVPLALAGVTGITVPVLVFGGGSAYGSWTPTPTPLVGETATKAADTCRGVFEDLPSSALSVAVAERRGGWTYVLLTGPRTEAVCLMPDEVIGRDGAAAGSFFGSYDPDVPASPILAPDKIVETTSQDGSTDEGWFYRVEGFVGAAVTALTVHTSSGLDIEASVAGNRFAAWWPSAQPSSDHPTETWSYTVQFADGTTRRTVCSQSTQPC